jgi:hypothetical protein
MTSIYARVLYDHVQYLAVTGEKIPDKFRFQEKGLFMI